MQVDLERTHASVPEHPEGHTVVLYPDDASPFLGQIEDRVTQRAIFNNMFKVGGQGAEGRVALVV